MATQTVNLEEMTVAELKDLADEEGIYLPSHATKDEIIAAIEEGQKNPGNPGAEPDQKASVQPLALTGPTNPIPLSDIVADSYGIGKRYNISLTDIQGLGAVVQGNFLLDNLPAGAIVQLVRVKHTQSLVGPGPITAGTAQVGDGTNLWGSTLDIFQAVSNTALQTAQLTANNVGPFAAVYPVYLTLIATGGNLGTATAGAVSVWLRYTLLGVGP